MVSGSLSSSSLSIRSSPTSHSGSSSVSSSYESVSPRIIASISASDSGLFRRFGHFDIIYLLVTHKKR